MAQVRRSGRSAMQPVNVQADGAGTAAIYLRVSTDQQDSTNQLPDCEQLARASGLQVVEVYADEGISGDAAKRPALERALLDAHRGRFKVLVAWSVDRISRDGATGHAQAAREAHQHHDTKRSISAELDRLHRRLATGTRPRRAGRRC